MFRNQYDTDVTTWSPQGRLFQVEYAMEAVKQGSAAVGLKSNTHVVLATLNRSQSELSSFQRKLFKIDDHIGIAISGLTADGRILCRYMRNECINHRFVYESPLPAGRLVRQIADKSQVNTQRSWKRPYGVGLLVSGYDKKGPQLFHTCPSGNFYEYKATAIGSRAQAAKTYLEKHYLTFPTATMDELIVHGLKALAASLQDAELTKQNCSVAVVGDSLPFTIIEDDAIEPFLQAVKGDEAMVPEPAPEAEEASPAAAAAAAASAAEEGDPPPDPEAEEQAPMES